MVATLQDLAFRRNATNIDRFVRQMTALARGRKFKDPQAALQRVKLIVGTKLTELKPRIEDAERTHKEVKARKALGELDELSARAEEVPIEVLTTLYNTLTTLHEKAQDPYTVSCVGVGADMLRASLDSGLMDARTYPSNREKKERFAQDKLVESLDLYRRVLRALDNTHIELGVKEPDFPTSAQLH